MTASVHTQPASQPIVYSNEEDSVIDILSTMRSIVTSQKELFIEKDNTTSLPNSPRRESLGSYSSNSSFNSYYSNNSSIHSGSYDTHRDAPNYLLTLAHHAVEESVNTSIQSHFEKSFSLMNKKKDKLNESRYSSEKKVKIDVEEDNSGAFAMECDDNDADVYDTSGVADEQISGSEKRHKPILKSISEPNLMLSNSSLNLDHVPLNRRNLPPSFWRPLCSYDSNRRLYVQCEHV